ncbi:LytR family transcriptional regulator, partial [Streptomyces buecherae]
MRHNGTRGGRSRRRVPEARELGWDDSLYEGDAETARPQATPGRAGAGAGLPGARSTEAAAASGAGSRAGG